ncbi:hypothetical protein B0H11DRAFT_2278497 [Mycena galericulata]|nr:hypothetical protein B0H11DRAFT_2278497 [Mycena galericulata]
MSPSRAMRALILHIYFYSLDDVSGFSKFNINNAPSCVFSVIKDILSVNPALKVRLFSVAIINMHVLMNGAHSTLPACMKSKPTEMMNGGTIASGLISAYPNYVLKAVQGFQNQGISNYAIPNEPENRNPTYPTCTMTPAIEGQIGAALRTLPNNNGLSSVKLVGYEVRTCIRPMQYDGGRMMV